MAVVPLLYDSLHVSVTCTHKPLWSIILHYRMWFSPYLPLSLISGVFNPVSLRVNAPLLPCAAQGFHSHLNHPSSILPRLLYSSPCLALPSASWAEAQWSAVQRYITSWRGRGGGGGRRGARKCTDADMKHDAHHQNGGWEEGKDWIKTSWRCDSVFFFFFHCSGTVVEKSVIVMIANSQLVPHPSSR